MISILSPFYNEELGVKSFFDVIIPVMESIGDDFEIVCVNDDSTDNTLHELNERAKVDKRIRVIDLSRNFGKEASLTAAIDFALGDAVIPIDVDLQDPPQIIKDMVEKWKEGFDVVLAKRVDRNSDSFLKRFTASAFYKIHNIISEPSIPENVGDFRLMSREVVEAIKKLPERHRFMKGLFAWVGFKSCVIGYTRNARSTGSTKFNGWKLWKLAVEGITSFSTFPLTMWLYLGGIITFCSFSYAVFIFMRTLIYGIELPDYASMICLILFLGGLQLVGIGVIGEYLCRTYIESKQRPIYIVRENKIE